VRINAPRDFVVNRRPIVLGSFVILLLAALAIWLASAGLTVRPQDVISSGSPSGPSAVLPPIASTPPGADGARAAASGGESTGAERARGREGRLRVTDGGAVPAGTRVIVRFDNPDYMAELPMREFMRLGPGASPDQYRKLFQSVRGKRKTGAAADVASDGTFRIDAPTEGRYFLDVESDTLYADTFSVFRATEPGPLVVRAVRGLSIRGVVLDGQGAGVPDARVLLASLDLPTPLEGSFTPREIHTTTGPDGRFVLKAVPARGRGTIAAMRRGFATSTVTMRHAEAAQSEVTLRLAPGGRIVGRVVDERFAPVAGARVDVAATHYVGFLLEIEQREPVITQASGSFEILDANPGRVRLHAEKAGLRPGDSLELEIRPNAVHDAGTIVLKRGHRLEGIVVDTEDKPVGGAKVSLSFAISGNPLESDPLTRMSDAAEATTDGGGTFSIDGLGKGPYDLEAKLPPFAPGVKRRHLIDEKPLKIRLRKPGAVEGTVRRASDGQAIANFDIEVYQMMTVGQGMPVPELAARQSFGAAPAAGAPKLPAGQFRVDGLAAGSYIVLVRAKGFAPLKFMDVSVKPAEPGVVDAELEPGAVLAGVVLDRATRRPLAGASLTRSTGFFDLFDPMKTKVVSDAEGKFRFEDLSGGDFAIVTQYSDYAPARTMIEKLAAGERRESLEIALGAGGAIEGTAYTEEGDAMANGYVSAFSLENSHMTQATLDAEGRFELTRLPAGSYTVNVFRGASLTDAMASNRAEMLRGMRSTAASVVDGETTRIVVGADAGKAVKVRGKVTLRGEPASGALVQAMPISSGDSSRGGSMRFTTTDKNGRFELSLPAGNVEFFIQKPGRIDASVRFARDVPDVPAWEVTPSLEMPLGSIEGVVRNFEGTALPEIVVRLRPESGATRSPLGTFGLVRTDEDGRFRFEHVDDGTYWVAAGGTFFNQENTQPLGQVSQRVEVRGSAEAASADFTLRPAGSIVGRVTSPNGTPIPGASMFLQTTDGRPVLTFSDVFSDSQGAFRARGIAPGSYRVIVRARGKGQKIVEPVSVSSGAEATVPIELNDGAPLTVRVTDAQGAPLLGASIRLTDASGVELSGLTGVTDLSDYFTEGSAPAAGEIRLGSLAPGDYRLRTSCLGYATVEQQVTITGSEPRLEKVALEKR